ncbi:MAG: hypothetical protein ACQETH_06080 [Candidatus Rifleibacteriota bacterium]
MPSVKLVKQIALISLFFIYATLCQAATPQIPEWYRVEISLDAAPQFKEKLQARVKVTSILGDLKNTVVRIIYPEDWKTTKEKQSIPLIKAGESKTLSFELIPTTYLSQGSIIAEAQLNVPFKAIEKQIKQQFDDPSPMISGLRNWPETVKGYSEISFALLEKESLYPLDSLIWKNYYEPLAPEDGFAGPVFYDDTVLTTYQAQTDVEMYEKLSSYLKADEQLKNKLLNSGIDLNKKKFHQLNGLFVLATRAFLSNDSKQAKMLIGRFEQESEEIDAELIEHLKIAVFNLKAIIFWQENNKRLAETYFKKAFYTNRKHPLQRYVLRNIALLMIARDENRTAENMMRLALKFNSGYTLLKKEYAKVSNP